MAAKTDIRSLLKELISIPSPYFGEDAVMAFVCDWLNARDIDAKVYEYHEARVTKFHGQNIIARLSGEPGGPTVGLSGHLDTVNLSGGWTKDPFAGETDGDRLFGLGALDMKAGCVAMMLAMAVFAAENRGFRGNILAHFASVEEGPFGLGTNAAIEDGLLDDADVFISLEPSAAFCQKPFPCLCLGAKGGYGVTIDVFGSSAHAAMPEFGLNAATDASKIVLALEGVAKRRDPQLGESTPCVIGLEADGGACSVPDFARIKLFWHIVTGETKETIRAAIEAAIARADVACKTEVVFREAPSEGSIGYMPYVVLPGEPFVAAFEASVLNVTGKRPEYAYFSSIGDFNYLATRLHVPTVIFGPGGANFHSPDEWVSVADTEATANILLDYFRRMLRV